MLYLVPMYRSWSPLSISTKVSTKKLRVTSLWRHIRKTVKIVKKWQNLFLTVKFLGTTEFQWGLWQKFLRMNSKHTKIKFGIKRKKKLYFFKKNSVDCTSIPVFPFLNDYPIPGGGGIPGNFFPTIMSEKDGKIMSQSHFRVK